MGWWRRGRNENLIPAEIPSLPAAMPQAHNQAPIRTAPPRPLSGVRCNHYTYTFPWPLPPSPYSLPLSFQRLSPTVTQHPLVYQFPTLHYCLTAPVLTFVCEARCAITKLAITIPPLLSYCIPYIYPSIYLSVVLSCSAHDVSSNTYNRSRYSSR